MANERPTPMTLLRSTQLSRFILAFGLGAIVLVGVSTARGQEGPLAVGAAMVLLLIVLIRELRPIATTLTIAVVVAAGATQLVPTVMGFEITTWLLIGLALVGLVDRLFGSPGPWITAGELAAIGLVLVGVLGIIAGDADSGARVAGLARVAQHVAILVAVASMPPTYHGLRWIAVGLLIGLTIQVAVGMLELTTGRTFFYSLWKPIEAATWSGLMRVGSTPADPNYFALGLVSSLPMLLAARSVWPTVPRVVVGVATVVWLVAIGFSFSRAGYLGLIAIPFLQAGFRRQFTLRALAAPTIIVLLVVTVIALGPALPFTSRLTSLGQIGSDASIEMRVAGQQGALAAFAEHPALGLGFDQFVTRGPEYVYRVSGIAVPEINALNTYLLVAAESGVVGLLLLLAMTAWALAAFRHAGRTATALDWDVPGLPALLEAFAVGLAAWSLISLTLDGLHSPILWILLGGAALASRWNAVASVGGPAR